MDKPFEKESENEREVTAALGGEENAAEEKRTEFQKLIEGEFKAEFEAEVQKALEKQNKAKAEISGERDEAGEAIRREKAARLYNGWLSQCARVRAQYPDFDLAAELKNDDFKELLRSGASIKAAYELVNREGIMRALAKDMEQKLIQSILSGAARPREGGLSAQSAAVVKQDAANMSKSARKEIIARVARGERITL